MAIYALEVKHRTKGKGASAKAHADYIAREGKYQKGIRAHELEYLAHGNMPDWAADSPMDFWEAADTYERANGRVYSEIQVALPRELSREERLEAVRELIENELGERHTYTVAIHNSKALDGNPQPHAHIMFSIRELDGVPRPREQFFKRANDKAPERGGAKKSRAWSKDSRENDRINEIRTSWEGIANRALERAGHEERIDRRSLKDQGIDREPEPKMGPIVTQQLKRGQETEKGGKVAELRNYRKKEKELEDLKRDLTRERNNVYEFEPPRRENEAEGLFEPSGPKREVPKEEKERYQRTVDLVLTRYKREDGRIEFRWKTSGKVAFVDEGEQIRFKSTTPLALKAGLQVAKEKGWESVTVKGSEEFRRESWLQAELMGVKLTGYTASKADYERLEELKREQAEKRKEYQAKEKPKDRAPEKPREEAKADRPYAKASDVAKVIDEQIRETRKKLGDPTSEQGKKLKTELDELYRDRYALKQLGDKEIQVTRHAHGKLQMKDRIQVRKMAKQVAHEREQGKGKGMER